VTGDRGRTRARATAWTLAAIAIATALAATWLAAASHAPRASAGRRSGRAAGHGAVAALIAGSLLSYMERDVGAAFARTSGYAFDGFGGGSRELASQIRGGVRRGDLFVSAAASADHALEGRRNGGWVSWYTKFAASPLMLAYNPTSRLGRELSRGRPWYRAIAEPGALVGRTDPKLDPKGLLTVEAIENASRRLNDAALSRALSSFAVYPETALVGRMQSGQLDAGFLYAVEACSAKLRAVALAPAYKYAEYTLTILNRAPDPSGAAALARYVLDAQRRHTFAGCGLTPTRATFSGDAASVPASLRRLVGAR
jgi:molybdate/tungstate transport system substrate-binding protein